MACRSLNAVSRRWPTGTRVRTSSDATGVTVRAVDIIQDADAYHGAAYSRKWRNSFLANYVAVRNDRSGRVGGWHPENLRRI